LKNYLDLEALRKRLVHWADDLNAYEEIIDQRRAYYEPLLPTVDLAFRRLDSQMRLRLEQRDRIAKRLKAMLVAPRPDYLATSAERIAAWRIAGLENLLARPGTDPAGDLTARLRRLRGILDWSIYTDYDRRLTDTYQHLVELNTDIEMLQTQYATFVRTRQAATQSYQNYDHTIQHLRILIRTAHEQVDTLMARQGHMLEVMAVNELTLRRERLAEFQVKTRFALADSYDRATRAQTRERITQ